MATRVSNGISQRLRFEVFARDGFRCQYCGDFPPRAILQVDHIVPACRGGTSAISNLITACHPCNIGKSDKMLFHSEREDCLVNDLERVTRTSMLAGEEYNVEEARCFYREALRRGEPIDSLLNGAIHTERWRYFKHSVKMSRVVISAVDNRRFWECQIEY